jgi:arginase
MEKKEKTLRLIMPQWQGGTLPTYYLGSQLLGWLAPPSSGPVVTVDVDPPHSEEKLPLEKGIVARTALLKQADAAGKILRDQKCDKVVVLGGDCLVSLAPFAYLSEIYENDLSILWVDAHPDIMTPEQFSHAHAMVLGNLMGKGDAEFASRVKCPVKAENIMYAGLYDMLPCEREFVEKHKIRMASPCELALSSSSVIEWFLSTKTHYLAIHLDLDVIDPVQFRSLYFTNPKASPNEYGTTPQGRMKIEHVIRLLNDINNTFIENDKPTKRIVGLTVAEYLPWDVVTLRDMLKQLPLIGE